MLRCAYSIVYDSSESPLQFNNCLFIYYVYGGAFSFELYLHPWSRIHLKSQLSKTTIKKILIIKHTLTHVQSFHFPHKQRQCHAMVSCHITLKQQSLVGPLDWTGLSVPCPSFKFSKRDSDLIIVETKDTNYPFFSCASVLVWKAINGSRSPILTLLKKNHWGNFTELSHKSTYKTRDIHLSCTWTCKHTVDHS